MATVSRRLPSPPAVCYPEPRDIVRGKFASVSPYVIVDIRCSVKSGRSRTMPAKRTYGMDQDFYPWSPIVSRPVLRWPDNARVALAVIVNLEHWDWEVPAGTSVAVSPMGGPEGMWTGNQPQFPDIGVCATPGYENGVGFLRFRALL